MKTYQLLSLVVLIRLALPASAQLPPVTTKVKKSAPGTPLVVPTEMHPAAAFAYGARIQPILMNLCASCHADDVYKGDFTLSRVNPGYANPEATAANLARVYAQLQPQDPLKSPLLTMSLTPHGGQRLPSLPSAAHPAYQNLGYWALAAVPPQPVGPRFGPAPVAFAPRAAEEPARLPALSAEPLVLPGAVVSQSPTSPKPAIVPAAATKPSDDPFDPNGFNQPIKK